MTKNAVPAMLNEKSASSGSLLTVESQGVMHPVEFVETL
jgi:hypothetical protein